MTDNVEDQFWMTLENLFLHIHLIRRNWGKAGVSKLDTTTNSKGSCIEGF